METRTVSVLGFRYRNAEGRSRYARRGQTVELTDEEAARGDALGAFVTEASETEEAEPTIGPESTDEELIAFVKDANVSEVIAAASDTAMAQRLLEAENGATGSDPRKGVAEGLAAVVGQA